MSSPGSTMDEGLLRVLRDHGVHRAGDRIGLKDLLAAWHQTKLRHDDLLASLKRLQGIGALAMQREAAGPSYVLGPTGEERVRRLPDPTPGILFLVGMTATGGDVPRRGTSYNPTGRQRRKTDARRFAVLPEIEFAA